MSVQELTFEDQLQSAISTSPYLSGRKLRVESESGCVVLHGEVGTFFQKQMAQETVRRIDGVREIRNRLEVTRI